MQEVAEPRQPSWGRFSQMNGGAFFSVVWTDGSKFHLKKQIFAEKVNYSSHLNKFFHDSPLVISIFFVSLSYFAYIDLEKLKGIQR